MAIKMTVQWFLRFLPITFFLLAFFWFSDSLASEESFDFFKGSWQCQEEDLRSTLEFQSQNELIYNGQYTSYQMLPNILRVQEDYGLVDYYFQVQDAVLIIFSPDGSVSYCQKTDKKEQQQVGLPQGSAQNPQQETNVGVWPPVYERPGYVDETAPSTQALLYKFAGRWDHVTTNTLTNLFLKPNGTYEEAYEAGYSGTFTDQGGYQTGNWGTAGTEQAQGTWRIEGSLRQGRIYLNAQNGNQTILNYQVHVQRGETFWGEYFFNGKLHSVKYIYR